jgi:2-octaprenyl-6-methoxyphenol hydroxylase
MLEEAMSPTDTADPSPAPDLTTPDLTVDVLIVGGGMVGQTLAVALGGTGLTVVLIDRADPASFVDAGFDGRVSAIAAGSRAVLEGIGVWPHLAAEAEPILDIRVTEANSPLFLHFDHGAVARGRRHMAWRHPREAAPAEPPARPFGHIIENRVIRTALLRRLADLPNVQVIAPAELAGVVNDPARALATLNDGRRIAASLVVGAEGRESALRHSRGIAATRWSYPQTAIVCTVAHEKPHGGVAHERFFPIGPFAILPMTDDTDENGRPRYRSSLVWVERTDLVPVMLKLGATDFDAEIARRFGDFLGRVTAIGPRWSYPLGLMHAERYVDDRLALIGDAAHAIHPLAGQGLNLGIRDVAALAEVLVDARRLGLDIGFGEVLSRYERWRRTDNVVLAAVTDGLNRLFSNSWQPLALARDLGLAAVDRVPPLKRFFMRHAMGLVGELPRLVKGEPL